MRDPLSVDVACRAAAIQFVELHRDSCDRGTRGAVEQRACCATGKLSNQSGIGAHAIKHLHGVSCCTQDNEARGLGGVCRCVPRGQQAKRKEATEDE